MSDTANDTTLDHTAIMARLEEAGDTDAVRLIEYWQHRALSAGSLIMEMAQAVELLAPAENNPTVKKVAKRFESIVNRAVKQLG